MKSVLEVIQSTTDFFRKRGVESPRLNIEHLLAHVLGKKRMDLYLEFDRPLGDRELDPLRELVKRRAEGEPLQHLLGTVEFLGRTFRSDARALVPRPETEVVVGRCLELLQGVAAPRVLDVGTGSGAIALALADEHPGARVTGLDSSPGALALARENAEATGFAIELVEGDALAGLPPGPWDLVVSNPPYVLPGEELPPELGFEPGGALISEGHTEAIARHARESLHGPLVLEVHSEHAEKVVSLLASLGYREARITSDLAGRDRVVEGRWEQ